MNKEKGKNVWLQEHKQTVFLVGTGIVVIAIAAIGYKYLRKGGCTVNPLSEKPMKAIEPLVDTSDSAKAIFRLPRRVPLHVRKLPAGQHASAYKIAKASELGINLLSNQTWVNSYSTKGTAA